MEKRVLKTLVIALALAVAAPSWAGNGRGFSNSGNRAGNTQGSSYQGTNKGGSGMCGLGYYLSSLPLQEVDDAEVAMLIKMRQEEKLARDVYLILYEKWGLVIFSNIANSEQSHMNAIKTLLLTAMVLRTLLPTTKGGFFRAQSSWGFTKSWWPKVKAL